MTPKDANSMDARLPEFGAGRGSDTEGAGARTPCPTSQDAFGTDETLHLEGCTLPGDHKLECDMGEDCTCVTPRRMAYADPPYPGQALRHYGKEGDPFEGEIAEVDHAELIEGLERDFPDGWALSTSVPALADILALCPKPEASRKRTWNGRGGVKLGTGVRVGAWIRSAGSPFPPSRVMWTWEPVIFRIVHWRQRHPRDFTRDSLAASQPHGFLGGTITGQKPEAFCFWIFDCLGLGPDDELVDLFPGSGAVAHAWDRWRNQTRLAV